MPEQRNCVCTRAPHASKESVIHTDLFFSLTPFAVMFAITAQLPVFSIKNSSLLQNVKDMANYKDKRLYYVNSGW